MLNANTLSDLLIKSGRSAGDLRSLLDDLEATGALGKASWPSGPGGNADRPAAPRRFTPERGQIRPGPKQRASGDGAREMTRDYAELAPQLPITTDSEALGEMLESLSNGVRTIGRATAAVARSVVELSERVGAADLGKSLATDMRDILAKAEAEDEEEEEESEEQAETADGDKEKKARAKKAALESPPDMVLRGDAMAVGTIGSLFDTILRGGNVAPPTMKADTIGRIRDRLELDDTLSVVERLSAANTLMLIEARQAGSVDAFTAKCRLGAVPSRVRRAIEGAAA